MRHTLRETSLLKWVIRVQSIGIWIQEHILLIFAIGIIICNFAWLMFCRKRLQIKWYEALPIAILHDIVGYAAMRLLAIIEVGGDISRAANMRLFGAVFVLPVLYYFVARIKKKKISLVMDIAAVCLVIGFVFGRFNCLVSGCCTGSRLPFCNLHWPLREIELLYYGVFLLYYCRRIHLGKTNGEVYAIFMITYGILRFILEWFRVEYTTSIGVFHLAHIWALITLLLGVSIYAEMKTSKTKLKRKRKA